jgi:hypothetical protein
MNRRTLLIYALATPIVWQARAPAVPYTDDEAADAAGALLSLTRDEQEALAPDTQSALGEALLWALKYERETSWLAASVLEDFSKFPALVTTLQGRLHTRAMTLGIR